MRRIVKDPNSEIIAQSLSYKEGNSHNNSRISDILFVEQFGFCAYTEEYLGRADAKDIEHFNPNLKGTEEDSYNNWYLVKHQWNKEKSTKWNNDILYPTAEDFETRIVYDNGDYRLADKNDVQADNLIKLIKLDDLILADERKRYINRKRNEIEKFNETPEDFFKTLIEQSIEQIKYLRAINEEFNIDIIELIEQNLQNHKS
ncbi:MAG: HNH endonuclease domain-containing protein [Chitinophagales bacterium]